MNEFIKLGLGFSLPFAIFFIVFGLGKSQHMALFFRRLNSAQGFSAFALHEKMKQFISRYVMLN
jgi:hypothetical protein